MAPEHEDAPTPPDRTPREQELRAEHRRLLHSFEYAYAMGHSRTLGRDPRLEWVVDRVAEL
jgi:hypothetical protein